MAEVVLYAGTSEGYALARFLEQSRVSTLVCTATEYGAGLVEEGEFVKGHSGRQDAGQMEEFLTEASPSLVLDATHPYASAVTENLVQACKRTEIEYVRVLRGALSVQGEEETVVYVEDTCSAVEFLRCHKGKILLTTGSKELAAYTRLDNFEERVYARVLAVGSVVEECRRLGLTGRHLLAMQGPFSKEMNLAMIREYDCSYLVTKDSGREGGFAQKLEAVREAGITAVVIGRPPQERGVDLWEARRFLIRRFQIQARPHITVAGIGMGQGGNAHPGRGGSGPLGQGSSGGKAGGGCCSKARADSGLQL